MEDSFRNCAQRKMKSAGILSSEGGAGHLSSSHGHLSASILVKKEPEDILPTSADEGAHSNDYGKMSPLSQKLDAHKAVVIKKEPEDAPPTSTDQSVEPDDCGNMSMFPLQLEGHGDNAVSVKIEPGESAFLQTDEGLCSGASDSASSVQVHLGELWKDGHLRGIEVPYKILAMPARADFRSEDSDRVLPSRLDLEGQWNNSCAVKEEADGASATSTCGDLDSKDACRLSVSLEPVDVVYRATVVVKEEPADLECQSSDSKENSSSSLSSQEQWDQAQQERQDRHRGHDCSFCPFSGSSKSELAVHESTHTHRNKGHYKCPACSQVFRQKDCLLAHNKFHAREKPYKCDTCGKRFSWESTFSRHQNVHVDLKPFKCASCPRTFKLKHNLTKHLRRDDCNEADVRESTDGDERPFKCPSCPKAFRGFHHLTAHKITHSDKRPFKCSTCPKTFHFRNDLSEHERVHSGEKPFKCTLCDKAFRTSGHLTSHRLVHTGEKPFKCPTCPKAFGMQWRLTMHKKNDHIHAQTSLRNLRISRCLSPEISGKGSPDLSYESTFLSKGQWTAHARLHE